MKLISKRIVCQISEEEARSHIRSMAYYFPPAIFAEDHFSIHFPVCRKTGRLFLTKLSGTITHKENGLNVVVELHAGLDFFLGCFMSFLGIIASLWYLFFDPARWLPGVGLIVLGLFIKSHYYSEGKRCINYLEKKLIH